MNSSIFFIADAYHITYSWNARELCKLCAGFNHCLNALSVFPFLV